jgi:ABC-type branched-subunit amino acid transport system ATPase component
MTRSDYESIELRAEHVTVRFGGICTIDNVTLSLRPGQLMG